MNEKTTTARPVKRSGYSSATLHRNRERKEAEANARQEKYDGLTDVEKIKLIHSRRGNSKRELTRVLNRR